MRRGRSKHDLPAYQHAMNEAHAGDGPMPDCDGRSAEFVDYAVADMPDKETAALMCERCPLLAICGANARHRRPQWGTWGGVAWVGGRQAHLFAPGDPRLVDQETAADQADSETDALGSPQHAA